jgi:5-methyltetrahydrofolate--homocysteine methyltransferase
VRAGLRTGTPEEPLGVRRGALEGRTLLDAATGTALIARGLPPQALPEEWVLSRPEEVRAVHEAHARAGAEVLLACTFNLAAPRLERRLAGLTGELASRAVALAREAAPGRRIAGALGPLGDPAGPDEVERRYARAAEALARAGAELVWLETQGDLAEARAGLRAARALAVAAVVTFTPRAAAEGLALADGTPAETCLAAVADEGAAAAGVNCVAPDARLAALALWARAHLGIPFIAKPAAGLPGAILPPDAFAAALRPALAAGVDLAGGCCGTTGEHLRALAVTWASLPRAG